MREESLSSGVNKWALSARARGDGGGNRHGRLFPEHALDPVAETLGAGETLGFPAREERLEFGDDVGVFHHVAPDLVDPRAIFISAEPELVFAWGFADEADLGHVGARATVRSAGHADDDFLVGEAEFR